MTKLFPVLLTALIYSILMWWPSRYLPYFWDSSGYLINTANDFFAAKAPLLISQYTDFAHPPLFPLLLSTAWHLFGNTRLVSHLLMLPFLPLLLISTYWLAKKYLPTTYAVFVAALVGLYPTVLAEYINVYVDLPSAALATAGLAALVYRRYWPSVIFLTLALLIKIPILTLLPIYFLLLPKTKKAYLLVPVVSLFVWLWYHHQMTGWWLSAPTRTISYATTPAQFLSSLLTIADELFIAQTKFVWTLILIAGGLVIKFKRIPIDREMKILLLGLGIGIIFFIITAEITPRYVLFLLPILALMSAYSLSQLLASLPKKRSLHLALMALPMALLVWQWRPSSTPTAVYDFLAPYNLHLYDYVHSFRQLATNLEANYSKAEIYGGFPESLMLTQPYQGYVSKPLEFYSCSQFVLHPTAVQLVVAHPYSPSQMDCAKLINLVKVAPVARFETNGIWLELYQVDATQSVTPK